MDHAQRNELLDIIAENVDQLITLDVNARGVARLLYDAARHVYGEPLAMAAAKRIADVVKPGDVAIIATGMLIYPYNDVGETDGPVGGAGLARALQLGLNAKPMFVTDERLIDMLGATVRAAGLNVVPQDRLLTRDWSTSVIAFPKLDEEARDAARRIIEEFSPKVIVAIERRGPNRKGVYHSIGGKDMTADGARVGQLFEEARNRGILTIGIGDGGNEIGFGAVRAIVQDRILFGTNCNCPCGGGMIDDTTVDILIPCTVSNWGAYGVEACLAAILGRPEVLHSEADESRMMRECADAGAIDGITHVPTVKCDGMPVEVHMALVALLHEIVRAPASGLRARLLSSSR